MRITNQMKANNITAQLFKQTERMFKSQEQIVTGKIINRPSDDPVGMSSVLSYRKTLSSLEQYDKNMASAEVHIQTVDDILDMVGDLLTDAKRIAEDPNLDMSANLATEIRTIREQVRQLANQQINGNYIFGGDITDVEPFNNMGVYGGDGGTKDVIIGNNVQINIIADGQQIFQGVTDIFAELDDLEADLSAVPPDAAAIKSHALPISEAIDQLKTVRAANAGFYQRLDATKNHNEYFKLNVEDLLSQTEDADMAEAIIQLQSQQTTYESTLATSAMIIQKSLVDFLR